MIGNVATHNKLLFSLTQPLAFKRVELGGPFWDEL